jgi:malonyl CoA-acyl carrier protein transacylase
MRAFVFPGQGTQHKGMGRGLFDQVREYAQVEPEVDALLGYSLRELCLEDPGQRLRLTEFTQPSLFVVNALHYYQAIAANARPDFVAGHSLGEYNALLAAGAFDLLTGLRLVKKRGELMAQAKNGAMAAVVGLNPSRIAQLLGEHALQGLDVANYNSPSQLVLSGPADEITRAAPICEKAGAQLYMPLPVSAAFHSRYMGIAAAAFDDFLGQFAFAPLQTPVVANVTGLPYPAPSSNEAVRLLLVKQITHPVQWTQSVRYLIERGVREFKEIGPGNVLTRLIQQTQSQPVR